MSQESILQTVQAPQTAATGCFTDENLVELITQSPPPLRNLRTFDEPKEDSVVPLEYAFHLLNGVRDRTVIDLGCGSGVNTVILAMLGARVIAIDRSDSQLETTAQRANAYGIRHQITLIRSDGRCIPARDGCAERVLCHNILEYPDPVVLARQIRRVLKPGGRAVFHEVAGRNMTKKYANTISRAVGNAGDFREFSMTTGMLLRILRRFPFARSFASSCVWSAHKES